MKKLITVLLSAIMVLSMSVSAFAALDLPTVDYVFNTDGFTYVFGSVSETIAEKDIGLDIIDKNGNKHVAKFSGDEAMLNKATASSKFGVEIKSNGMLDESFLVAPYFLTADNYSTPRNLVFRNSNVMVNPEAKTITKETVVDTITMSKMGIISPYSSNKNKALGNANEMQFSNTSTIGKSNETWGLATFNLAELDITDADKIYIQFGTKSANDANRFNNLAAKINIDVFDTVDNSNYPTRDGSTGATYNTTIGAAEETGMRIAEKVFTFTQDDAISIYTTSGNANVVNSSNKCFAGFKKDITKFIQEKKRDGAESITLLIKAGEAGLEWSFSGTNYGVFSGIGSEGQGTITAVKY